MQKHLFGTTRRFTRKTLTTLTCALALSAGADAQSGSTQDQKIAFVGATVVSPHLASPIEDAVVLVRGGKIEAVGPASLAVGEDYETINLEGRYVAPGLIDAHMHFFQSASAFTRPDSFDFSQIKPYKDDRVWVENHIADTATRYLMSGVTAVADMCGPSLNYKVRAEARASSFMPTVATAGACIASFGAPVLDLQDGDPVFQHATSAEAAVAFVREQLALKPDMIKIIWSPDGGETPQQLFNLFEHAIRLAQNEGIPVAVHATDLANAKMAVRAGASILVHGVMTEAIDDEFIALVKQHNVVYVPTLAVHGKMGAVARDDLTFSSHEHKLAHPDILASFDTAAAQPEKAGMMVQMIRKYMPYVDAGAADVAKLSPQEQAIVGQLRGFFSRQLTLIQRANLKRMYDAGVTLALGTDAGNPGVVHGASMLTEMTEWQHAGLPLPTIFKAATLNGAKVMKMEAFMGSIEVGKWADFMVLDANPLKSLESYSSVAGVVKHGSYMSAAQLTDRLEE
ncbi:amidohydrolase family protein [Kordiimonas gwangyangensis]|uniref:amidohydrolase family protein n=1 Tax=Kordiimonas gwangyangensis TaxID=288022 RepID=UPI000361F5F4|nr:amidohydrolase family protein [Kordiimonas gwangyangensis]